jgi:class 3 adenylate cyclase/tetratricopeptide (TPR) repeat protein
MTFDEVLDRVLELLRREGRVSYSRLKRQFDLDDDYLADLKDEIIEAKRLASDENGKVLVWSGEGAPAGLMVSPRVRKRVPLSYTPRHLSDRILAARSVLEGERKQVTVLFADIMGSTELIADLDPEEARQILDPAIHRMMDAVHRYEGTVNQVLGDGIMALFGAPLAHEDHAIRACYAALAMQTAMRDYAEEARRAHGVAIRIRVGLNSGEVVVRVIGNDLHMDYSAVGQTTHLAARMEQLVDPGGIMLTAATLRLVEGMVRVRTLGPVPVKGMSEPVEVYELIGVTAFRRRLQAAVARGLTPFVGRQAELAALSRARERAGAGHGQAVAIVGNAGVGKSRLVYEFIHSHHLRDWLVLESASESYGKSTPYFPVIDLLKRYLHIEEDDETRAVRAKVTGQVLTLDEALQDSIPALLTLLDALPDDSPFLRLDPPQRRQRTLDAVQRLFLRESRLQPVLLVFEDLHWSDSETQALLDSLVDSLPTARLLLLVDYRPEYEPGWGDRPCYAELRLEPLPSESAEAFLQGLLGDHASLTPLKQHLIAWTQGNPLFLEECVRTLVETEALSGARGAYRLERALPSVQVPATVQAVLAARIDRLPPDEKQLLQTAAVIGLEVPLPLLQALVELSEETLQKRLDRLQTAEFLYATHAFPEHCYAFKHALTHEVVYGSVLHERRRVLHGRILEALESLAGDRLRDRLGLLARHAWRGEVWDKALVYSRQAGVRALEHSAYREAAVYFEQALETLEQLPKDRARRELAIDLRLDLRNALFPLGQLERIVALLRQAERLGEALDDPLRLGRVYLALTVHFLNVGDGQRVLECGKRALVLGEAGGDVGLQVVANTYLGMASLIRGDFPAAIDACQRALAALEGERRREHFGQVALPAVHAHSILAWGLAEIGDFAEAIRCGEAGFSIAEVAGHPASLVYASLGSGMAYLRQGDVHKAIALLERVMDVWHDIGSPSHFLPVLALSLGPAYTLAGRVAEALSLLEQAVEQSGVERAVIFQPFLIVGLAEATLLDDRATEAHDLAVRARDLARTSGQRGSEAWSLWLLGAISARRTSLDTQGAEANYRQALVLAQELGMRPLQAHCWRGLGALYVQSGRAEQAHTACAAAGELYRALDMTFWLPQVEDELESGIELSREE